LFSARRLTTFSLHNTTPSITQSTPLSSVRPPYPSPPLVVFELPDLMLSRQNALSITWRTAVDSGELLLVLGPESIQPGQYVWLATWSPSGELLQCYLFSARRLTTFFLHNTTPSTSQSTRLSAVRLPYPSHVELLANLMLSRQNALSITWPTAVDSGELLLVLGPESIQPSRFLWPVHLIMLR